MGFSFPPKEEVQTRPQFSSSRNSSGESFVRPKMNLVALLAVLFLCCVSGEATLFEVGGSNGSLWTWRVPSNEDFYRSWANSTDFAVGDTIHFRYKNDSVLVVSQNDFETCNGSNPIITYFGENTYYMFDLPGAYYFISGELEHCAQGQKLAIHVTSSATLESPPPAPIPSPDMSIVGGSTQNKPSSSGPRNAIITIIIFVCVVLLLAIVAAAYRVVRPPHSHGFRDLKKIEMIEAV
ncbi:hypothetical protein LUZ63_005211 [Rhynchospora breviuscula]|uniref:Phytocyanin domain-containing protein n=1 Tax=Rhynchospora breviuscula TaxID=2022672 RepID=A0A9Q0CMG6_9POAL|nr:hypothetical protein LUZ63_005211 [Rhynchospora breviuscula]